jgi:hypothetical protein
MKQETINFIAWLEQQEKRIKPRISSSRGEKWTCYSLDVTDAYETLPDWLHDDISHMEAEETQSREFWIPGAQSYHRGIGKLLTEDWIDFKLKWKYKI